ncbi:MAG: hypothetical protein ACREUE_02300 [Panacagrimonas sp.]
MRLRSRWQGHVYLGWQIVALMLAFTAFGLWILAQPITAQPL